MLCGPAGSLSLRPLRPSPVLADLVAVFGADEVVVDPDILIGVSADRASTISPGQPLASIRVRSIDEVSTVLRIASSHSIPVVVRGAGTGLSGGANAVDGCLMLVMDRMDAIIEIDVAQRLARVQCGVLNEDLDAAAAELGLWYPPDPSSRAISTIGGNIATNAGGSCCLKYGVTGDHVAALTCVLVDGTVVHTGASTRKNVVGLDLTRLIVGSEGTLAVVVEATVRLQIRPRHHSTVAAFFNTPYDAIHALDSIRQVAQPSLAELMDRTTIGAVEATVHMGLDIEAGALLLVQFDTDDAADKAASSCKIVRNSGASEVASTTDPHEGEQFLHARRMALPSLERLGATILDDVCVPTPSIGPLVEAIEEISRHRGVTIATFGHAGDGNLHPTIVFDGASTATRQAAMAAFDDIVEATMVLGGSITGEHGVGLLKQAYMDRAIGTHERDLMRRIKSVFDPAGLLNPGKGY